MRTLIGLVVAALMAGGAFGKDVFYGYVHVRNVEEREWSDWPEKADWEELRVGFSVENAEGWRSLVWRQDGVKEGWEIVLNGKVVGRLISDDKDMRGILELPEGALKEGRNDLIVRTKSEAPDDIRVGRMRLGREKAGEVRNAGSVKINVTEHGSGVALPSRITVVDAEGSLALVGAVSDDRLTVRSGVVYTVDGVADFGLEAGKYTVYAGRGFEYGVAKAEIEVEEGEAIVVPLGIGREVDTEGWVACDPHLHSWTYAGHGDATFTERVIALAGEGVEMPISTEHNQHIDFGPEVKRLGLEKWMTPVIGNEVTTDTGHFNIWPVEAGAEIPMTKLRPWEQVFKNIYATPGVRVCILNHPSDVHRGYLPFGSEHFVPMTGENLDGWQLEANAVEVVNSGALNHDPLESVRGWMGLLNAGHKVIPVGASDSHSVSFSIAGQGRTYIRGDDLDAGKIDVNSVTGRFLDGEVGVSMGLFAELSNVWDEAEQVYRMNVSVKSPSWTTANRLLLFRNGDLEREMLLDAPIIAESGGKEWKVPEIEFRRELHDAYYVAVVLGPGIEGSFWPSKRPYQRESPEFTPYVMAVTGAVWVDGTRGIAGEVEAPIDSARALFAEFEGDIIGLLNALENYDYATAAQVGMLLRRSEIRLSQKQLLGTPPEARRALEKYAEATGWEMGK